MSEEKKFTQDEVNEIVRERVNRFKRKFEREQDEKAHFKTLYYAEWYKNLRLETEIGRLKREKEAHLDANRRRD
ncbi:hypothetical protein SAMN05421687_10824 [Salimicrobium flavidum]|uniref:Uncharacterized protein n=1 Tax=Salimicrobium flavidum TaxID=570947 RepID=A0A1N7JXE5_9BACI|nr:hypothetical protein SAMN05421687_10824 [Salimicrobium flavidum]